MRRDGDRRKPVLSRHVDYGFAQYLQRRAHFGDVPADTRADLDLRAKELGLDLLTLGERFALL